MKTRRAPWLAAASAALLLLLAACGGGGGSTTGTLAVTVSAPTGITLTPNVTVTGPTGTAPQTITALGSTSLTTAPGSYTLTAKDATGSDGYTYSAPGATATVQTGKTTAVTVAYAASTGKLTINISGAPTGFTPSVSVTSGGTAVSGSPLSATGTLNLAAGTYAVASNTPAGYVVAIDQPAPAVTAGQTTTVNVVYTQGLGSIGVTVAGLPSATAASVTATQTAGGTFSKTASITGTGTISGLPLGTYKISGAAVTVGGVTYAATDTTGLNVTNGATTPATLTYAATTGSITVTVSGLPVSSTDTVSVTATPSGGSAITQTRTGNGTVSFTNLTPGNYTIAAADVATPTATPTALYKATIAPTNPQAVTAGGNKAVTATYAQAATSIVVSGLAALPGSGATARLLTSTGTVYTQPIVSGSATFSKATLGLSSELPLGTYYVSAGSVVTGSAINTPNVATFGTASVGAVVPSVGTATLSTANLTQTVTASGVVPRGGAGHLYTSGNGPIAGGNKGILFLDFANLGAGLQASTTPVASPAYYKVAFDSEGYYYVSARDDTANSSTITVYTEANLRNIEAGNAIGSGGFAIAGGPLVRVADMTFDSSGNLWVANEDNTFGGYVTCYSAARLEAAKAAAQTSNTVTVGAADVALSASGTNGNSGAGPSFAGVRALALSSGGLWIAGGSAAANPVVISGDEGNIVSRIKTSDLSCPYTGASGSIANKGVLPDLALRTDGVGITKISSLAVSADGSSLWLGDFGPNAANGTVEYIYQVPLSGANIASPNTTTYNRINAEYGYKLDTTTGPAVAPNTQPPGGMQQIAGLGFDKSGKLWVATNNNISSGVVNTTNANGLLLGLTLPTTAATLAATPTLATAGVTAGFTTTNSLSASIGLTGLAFNTIAP